MRLLVSFLPASLKTLQSISADIPAGDDHVFTVTSEADSELPKMQTTSGYIIEIIVDPENVLAKELKGRGVIDVAISDHNGYPHGMLQPAVLIGAKHELWYRWVIVPATASLLNFGRQTRSISEQGIL